MRARRALVASALALAAVPSTASAAQLVPAYFYPSATWDRMCNTMGSGSIAVMNPNSGPGSSYNPDYQRVIDYCHARGKRVISYVHTSYGARHPSAVKADIDATFSFYPSVDGVFVDEMSTNPRTRGYYQEIYLHTHSKGGSRLVVGNPGVPASTGWQLETPVVDLLNIFEGTASQYLNWRPPTWVFAKPASRFVHLVYSASSTQMERVCQRSKSQNVGYMYVTNDGLPNPWDTLPSSSYWTREIGLC